MSSVRASHTAITACLVIHNEEEVLTRCLRSISKVTRTILVVHDGPCTDKSLAICRAFGAKCTVRPFVGEAEPHRAWLMAQVRTPYCLQIDADEYLSEEFIDGIDALLAKQADGYTCHWPYWNGQTYMTTSWPRKLCLFRLSSVQYLAAPHEAVRVTGTIIHTPFRLHHKPRYDNLAWSTFRTKWIRWAAVHAEYYVMPADKVARFHDPKHRLVIHYRDWMRWAPWSAVTLGIYHALLSIMAGGWREGLVGLRASLCMGAYYSMVSYFVWRKRHGTSS